MCFQNVKKEKNDVLFLNNSLNFKKSDGIKISKENLNFNKLEPYTLIGKIMQIENGKIYLLTSFINKIIIISDPEKIFKNIFDYQYIQIYYIRFDLEEENIIYFKTTTFTSFKMLQNDISIINEISSKIVLKFNLLDFENGYEEIKIKNIGIELDDKEIKIIKTNKKVIFIVYEIKYIEYEYFPQKIYLDDESNSFPYQLQFFVYKGFMTEVNLFIKNNFGLSYEFLYFSLNNNFPNEIGNLGKY